MIAPLPASRWDLRAAAHLLNRAGFGGSPAEIQALHARGLDGAVSWLLSAGVGQEADPPDWAASPPDTFARERSLRALPREEREEAQKALRQEHARRSGQLVGWWLRLMRAPDAPLREKLTLFWHGHFATSQEKVREPYAMYRQNQTLRALALGNFGDLVKAISRDPAMMEYLDTQRSRRFKPNENFARELLELFTLGIGHYTEDDIREAARAFTGYRIMPVDVSFRFSEMQHDGSEKTFMGKTGPFSGDDIIEIALARPECAMFITRKLWAFFASDHPDPALTKAFADLFRSEKLSVAALLEAIFRSEAFYSEEVVRSQIKSPVQYIVTLSKQLETSLPPGSGVVGALRSLGQVPFRPPSVKGWDGGKAWITTSTLLARYNLALQAIGLGEPPHPPGREERRESKRGARRRGDLSVDYAKLFPEALRSDPKALLDAAVWRMFQTPLPDREMAAFAKVLETGGPISEATLKELLRLMSSTPQYQLT